MAATRKQAIKDLTTLMLAVQLGYQQESRSGESRQARTHAWCPNSIAHVARVAQGQVVSRASDTRQPSPAPPVSAGGWMVMFSAFPAITVTNIMVGAAGTLHTNSRDAALDE